MVRFAGFWLTGLMLTLPIQALAQDSDADGAPDGTDAHPCDANVASVLYAPAQNTHGSLLFEDLWPFEFADLDFNDVHLTWHYEFRRNTAGQVTQIIATYNVLALGADLHHGLGLHLPLPASAVGRVIRQVGGESLELQPTWQDATPMTVMGRFHFP